MKRSCPPVCMSTGQDAMDPRVTADRATPARLQGARSLGCYLRRWRILKHHGELAGTALSPPPGASTSSGRTPTFAIGARWEVATHGVGAGRRSMNFWPWVSASASHASPARRIGVGCVRHPRASAARSHGGTHHEPALDPLDARTQRLESVIAQNVGRGRAWAPAACMRRHRYDD